MLNSLASSQINIKPHTKGLFISIPITCYLLADFQQEQNKLQYVLKGKKTQSEEARQAPESLRDDTHVGLKITA